MNSIIIIEWGREQIIIPANDASKPITEWSPKEINIDVLHHVVYYCAVEFPYDAIRKAENNRTSGS